MNGERCVYCGFTVQEPCESVPVDICEQAINAEQFPKVGDRVFHRHRQDVDVHYRNKHVGTLIEIKEGQYYVDCGNEFINVWCSLDIGVCKPGTAYK